MPKISVTTDDGELVEQFQIEDIHDLSTYLLQEAIRTALRIQES
jgi:hypothetical protein